MRARFLPALILITALAAACSKEKDQRPAAVAPPVGANLGPNTTAGRDYSPFSGSVSNGASGSSIPQQEGRSW